MKHQFIANKEVKAYVDIPDQQEYTDEIIRGALSKLFDRNQNPAVLREPGFQETIVKMFLKGERDILFWDEMTKFSEMSFIASCMPFSRPIVDICCGYGYWISKVLLHIDLGVDLFPDDGSMYARSIYKIEENEFIDRTYQCVLRHDCRETMPIPDHSCSTVMCISGMEHIADYEKVLRQVSRILASGGTFLLTVSTNIKLNTYYSLFSRKYMDEMLASKNAVNFSSLSTWERALADHGFVIKKAIGYLDCFKLFIHAITSYPECYNAFWNQKSFSKYVRGNFDASIVWQNEFLPWLCSPCPLPQAGLIGFECTAT